MAESPIQNLLHAALREQQAGRFAQAEQRLRSLLARDDLDKPTLATIHSNLGFLCGIRGLADESLAHLRTAAELTPADAIVLCNLGIALERAKLLDEAADALRKAIELKPDLFAAYTNLGTVLRSQGKHNAAADAFREALRLNIDLHEVRNHLAGILKDRGQLNEALTEYRHILQRAPGYHIAHSNLLLAMHYAQETDPQTLFAGHQQWARQHADPLKAQILPHANNRDPNRRLRIGYISPDFRQHSVGYFIEPILANRDHTMFEVHCFADERGRDAATDRLRGYADRWHNITALTDDATADLVRREQIDILIDLAGHTGHGRLLTLARKPAPIQITYLGYPNTTGLSTVDYRFTDAYADPPGQSDSLHTEQLIRLPHSAWCFQPPMETPDVAPLPADISGHITFGCFNALPKMTPQAIDCWAEILKSVEGSRLVLKNQGLGDAETAGRVRDAFAARGIAGTRIDLHGQKSLYRDHLEMYAQIDIGLDPFPYHGTATTCEALWMGVPVITLAGKTHVSRVGVSLMTNVGLPHLIAKSAGEYVSIAKSLAADLPGLSALRAGMRERMRMSPLYDGKGITRQIEREYRRIWHIWAGGDSAAAPVANPAR